MKRLALKIDVDTYRGTLRGVPALVDLLTRQQAGATFLFSLGPDHTGRAIRRAFRPGFMKKVKRTSVLEHYGLLTLMYGVVLPGPNIGRRCGSTLRAVRDAGFEVGVHCWDHVRWQDGVVGADNAWVETEMTRAVARFTEIFGEAPRVHGAAGWQMNRHALRLTQRLGFAISSDCRGTHPFIPVIDGEIVACPQLPTTLPTLDELIGVDDITADSVANHLLALTAGQSGDQVFTLHAELEGMRLLPQFERLLEGWKEQGFSLVSMADMAASLDLKRLPRHAVCFDEVPGRSGKLLVQGPEFPG
ncbi:4-deoxy-4-formamido-L-arabinose-phosphoundecaprenol deformylase [Rhodocyclus tenuis]|uniref:polysaccharide deacetylase family protein n=1 Tax=Rhodocyclus gracilis TaxID=2929842 RepID=UPI001298944B|nr:polysaccharide deacetylase family protein [Rhodocyclus gracilis]MRD72525.1 4-deoxy-4-formamido-L-arabinose-phosphoundecaprenol deformylase [Rhodocyclus gracilis]